VNIKVASMHCTTGMLYCWAERDETKSKETHGNKTLYAPYQRETDVESCMSAAKKVAEEGHLC